MQVSFKFVERIKTMIVSICQPAIPAK